MWKNTVETDRPQVTIWSRALHASCETINTILEYVLILAFPLQQWLRERATILSYTNIVCLLFVMIPQTVCSVYQKLMFLQNRNDFLSQRCTVNSTVWCDLKSTVSLLLHKHEITTTDNKVKVNGQKSRYTFRAVWTMIKFSVIICTSRFYS
jgi:hypothetical protein